MRSAGPLPPARAAAEVLLCSGFVTQAAIGLLLRACGLAPFDADGHLVPAFVFALASTDTVVLLGLIAWLLHGRGESLSALARGTRPVRREVLLGAGLAPLLLVGATGVVLAVRALVPALHNVPDNPLARLLGSPAEQALFALVVLIAGAVREELQRAFLLHRFAQALGGARVGVIVTSVAFGLGHALQGWDATVATGLLGALWGGLTLARGSAVLALTSHAVFNLAELARAALLSA